MAKLIYEIKRAERDSEVIQHTKNSELHHNSVLTFQLWPCQREMFFYYCQRKPMFELLNDIHTKAERQWKNQPVQQVLLKHLQKDSPRSLFNHFNTLVNFRWLREFKWCCCQWNEAWLKPDRVDVTELQNSIERVSFVHGCQHHIKHCGLCFTIWLSTPRRARWWHHLKLPYSFLFAETPFCPISTS